MSKYAHLDTDALIRLLERRDAQRQLGLVWERDDDEVKERIAELLDGHALVHWWHRNPRLRRPDAVGLYAWDDGDGFFPDFVVSVEGRKPHGGIALLEVKGSQLWGTHKEPDKAEARHPDYGQVFMVGRERGKDTFMHLRKLDGRLQTDGKFGVDRLRW